MSAHARRVDRDVPVHVTRGVGCGLDLLQQMFPGAICGPQPVALVNSLPGPEPLGKVAPLHTGPHSVQNPVDYLPMVPPPATTTIAHRQERPESFPLGIRQVTTLIPPHTQTNEPGASQSHDRPDSS